MVFKKVNLYVGPIQWYVGQMNCNFWQKNYYFGANTLVNWTNTLILGEKGGILDQTRWYLKSNTVIYGSNRFFKNILWHWGQIQ